MFEITNFIELNNSSGIPLIQQLRDQFTWLIVSEKLKPGDRLPSVRVLATELQININTVRNAYQLLAQDSLVTTRHGTGTIVLPVDPSKIIARAKKYRSNTIGVILPAIHNPFYHTFLQGVEEISRPNQTMMLICNAHEDPDEALRFYTKLVTKQVDGIICASLPLAQFLSKIEGDQTLLPFVSVDWPEDKQNTVQLDLENAGFLATSHLIEHGYQKIGLITLAEDLANTIPLMQGYKRALKANRVPFSTDLVVRVPGFSLEDGIAGAKGLLSQSQKPDAIFAITDVLALGAIKHLKNTGLQVPQDIAVIGVGDIYLSDLVEPQLTTVSLPAKELGIEAMKMLQSMIDGHFPEKNRVILPVSFVERNSCGTHMA